MDANPLAQYLARRRISQGEFGRRLGVARGVVCRWVTGKRIPATPYANAIQRETGGEVPASVWGAAPAPEPAKGRRPAPRRTAARDLRTA